MNYKVLWSELKGSKVIIHLERLDNGAPVDVTVEKDEPETWDALMSEATAPE